MENIISVEPKAFETFAIILEKHPLSGSVLIFIALVVLVLLPKIRNLVDEYVHGRPSNVQAVLSQQELINKEKNDLQEYNRNLLLEKKGLEMQYEHCRQSLEHMQTLLHGSEKALYKAEAQACKAEEEHKHMSKRLDRLIGNLSFLRSQLVTARDLSESAVTKSLIDTALNHLEELYRNID